MNKLKKFSIIALTCVILSLAISTAANAYDWDGDGIDDGSWDDYYGNEAAAATWGLFGLTGIVCVVVFLIPLIIGILLAIWVYKDAEKRGSSGILWLIIVLLTGIIGLIIWLVVRPPIGGHPQQQQASGRMCTNCGRPIPMDARVCPYCGKNFQS